MKQRRRSLRPAQHKPLRMGPPRVVEDTELYHIVSSFADPRVQDGRGVDTLIANVQSWCKPWQDWQLEVIALRARLFLGCIRRELGRRQQLDPNQLRLLKGM